jgi:hypothetical protein
MYIWFVCQVLVASIWCILFKGPSASSSTKLVLGLPLFRSDPELLLLLSSAYGVPYGRFHTPL